MKKRIFSVFLALAIFVSILPNIGAVASTATDNDGLCPHHTEHDEDCGYIAADEGVPCSHEHTEDCYVLTESCGHTHDVNCYSDGTLPTEGEDKEADLCDHVCTEDTGCVTLVADCGHTHDVNCYSDGTLPTEGEDKEADLCDHVCTEDTGCVTLVADCGHTHDEACGYAEPVDGVPCGFVCEICEGLAEDTEAPEETTEVTTPSDVAKIDAAVEEVQALIASLPSAEAVVAMNEEEQQTAYEYIQAVYNAYLSLSEEQRELIVGAEVFDELFALFNDQTEPLDVAAASNATGSSKELHFIVRHWHTTEDVQNNTQLQGDELQSSNDRYFVVVEGYIVPQNDGTYKFYLVYQDGNEGLMELDENEDYIDASPYVQDVDTINGTITLNAAAVAEMEDLITFSVSAGHDAIADNSGSITIQYKQNVHLVKAHVFYLRTKMIVAGTDDETVFETVSGSNTIASYPQQDTAWVYTYVNDDGTHKAGEIAKNPSGAPYKKGDTLPEDLEGQVQLTKVYSTNIGLHTDKTASVYASTKDNAPLDDGRTFNLDLEAWYAEGYASQVGMILDASGSMGFASDKPEPIKVSDFDAGVQAQLQSKIGLAADKGFTWAETIAFPQYDKLLGYYEFRQNSGSGTQRTWYLNTKIAGVDPASYWDTYPSGNEDHFAGMVQHAAADGSGSFDFSDTKTLIQSTDGDSSWTTWGSVPAKFDASYGFSLSSSLTKSAFIPETQPTGNDFTLSFTLGQSANDDTLHGERIEILYIGALTGNVGDNNYFHVYRQGNNVIVCMGKSGEPLFTLNTNFSRGITHELTFVFNGNTVQAYLDGVSQGSAGISGLSGHNVVFAPFANDLPDDGKTSSENTNRSKYLTVDSIYLFNVVLSGEEIGDLVSVAGDALSKAEYEVSFDAFLTPAELALLMDPHNTDNSKLGSAGYTYFVYDASSNDGSFTQEYTPLGYYPDDAAQRLSAVNGDGWYYSSYTSDWSYYKSGTAKNLHGITDGQVFTDHIEAGANKAEVGWGAAPDLDIDPNNTDKTYTATGSGPSKFYIDENGYLRCFFSPNSYDHYFTSYVYKLSDSQYIKAEALQRALGLFVTELAEQSPATQVSAVRFHSNGVTSDELNMLVLLDWTNNPGESASIMALKRGDGTTTGSDTGANGAGQYNYALTGNTSTWRGLQAYVENLQKYDNPYKDANGNPADGVPKYLIIFTDGKDTDQNNTGNVTLTLDGEQKQVQANQAAKTVADYLKNECGYTIFTVLLNGGPVEENGADYEAAHSFLTSLSGYKDATATEQEDCFFSVSKAKRTLTSRGVNISGMNDADILTEIFAEEILRQITRPLEDYIVQDYIDPRFDLVDADGVIWRLNDGGYVVKGDSAGEDGTFTLNTELKTQIKISGKSNQKALEPYLCYDNDNGMYYLVWTGQTIPSSAIGANRLAVWNAQVTVRAKDDFIGGNAVLTNGNDGTDTLYGTGNTDNVAAQANNGGKTGQNYVYFGGTVENGKTDDRRSSGIDDMYRTGQVPSSPHDWSRVFDDYPSKGFPRVTVNVQPYETEKQTPGLIYMGQTLRIQDIVQNLIDAANDDRCAYYWEYLERLGEVYDSADLAALTQTLLEDGVLEETYRYLPAKDTDAKTLTGTDAHRADIHGKLTYQIIAENPDLDDFQYGEAITKKDTKPINVTLTVDYDPLDDPSHDDSEAHRVSLDLPADRKEANDTLVQENVYHWDPDYKPAAGEEWTNKVVIEVGDHVDVVSGQIILQMQVGADVAGSVTYKAELWRTYTDTSGTVQKEKVGTLEATGSSGQTVSAKLTGLQGDYATYVPIYGLPIGTYTLVPSSENADGFSKITAIAVEQDVFAAAHSDPTNDLVVYDLSGGKSNQVTDFPAESSSATTTDDATAYLGTKDPAKGAVYTDDRYAQFLVTIDDTPTVPKNPTGKLTVTKKVTGNAGETDREFHFTVTIGDETFTFNLKDGESWTSEDFTAGTEYSVTETDANEYGYTTTMPGNATGTIQGNQTVTVEVVNHKEGSEPGTDPDPTDPTPSPTPDTPLVPAPSEPADDVPQTGDNSNLALWMAFMVLSLAGIVVTLFSQKKTRLFSFIGRHTK